MIIDVRKMQIKQPKSASKKSLKRSKLQIENANRTSIWDSAELYFRIHDNIL